MQSAARRCVNRAVLTRTVLGGGAILQREGSSWKRMPLAPNVGHNTGVCCRSVFAPLTGEEFIVEMFAHAAVGKLLVGLGLALDLFRELSRALLGDFCGRDAVKAADRVSIENPGADTRWGREAPNVSTACKHTLIGELAPNWWSRLEEGR